MFSILSEYQILSVFMIVFLFISILFQMIPGVIVQRLKKESENIRASRNPLFKKSIQKYANYYQLNGKMANTDVFAEKVIKRLAVGRISVKLLQRLSGQAVFFFILTCGMSIFIHLSLGKTLFEMTPYYLISIAGLYLYFSAIELAGVEEKKEIIKANLVDYLDNHLGPRIQMEIEEHPQEQEEPVEKKKFAVYQNQQELEELLEEFLIN